MPRVRLTVGHLMALVAIASLIAWLASIWPRPRPVPRNDREAITRAADCIRDGCKSFRERDYEVQLARPPSYARWKVEFYRKGQQRGKHPDHTIVVFDGGGCEIWTSSEGPSR